jgi:SAM-dependent methyltransferase
VSKPAEIKMPEDWNDQAGWDAHYRYRLQQEPPRGVWDGFGCFRSEVLPQLAADLKSRGRASVWVPGCGISPLPRLLALQGLTVVATDISAAAVAFQQGDRNDVTPYAPDWEPVAGGSLTAEVHDFREDFRREAFDLILNVKAFQGFPVGDLGRIAAAHARSLKPGGHAYFETMNVQGQLRDDLEGALEGGGFIVPLAALNRWYRGALRDSGIPHAFLMGLPLVRRTGEYNEEERWQQGVTRLGEITAEYESRLQAAQEADQARVGPEAKVATVIYVTG